MSRQVMKKEYVMGNGGYFSLILFWDVKCYSIKLPYPYPLLLPFPFPPYIFLHRCNVYIFICTTFNISIDFSTCSVAGMDNFVVAVDTDTAEVDMGIAADTGTDTEAAPARTPTQLRICSGSWSCCGACARGSSTRGGRRRRWPQCSPSSPGRPSGGTSSTASCPGLSSQYIRGT